MQLPIQPCLLSQQEFNALISNWEQVANGGNPDQLRACFTRDNALMNYVYIPGDLVGSLMADSSTSSVRLKFVVVTSDNPDEMPVFSIALYGIDDSGHPSSPYQLAGVAAVPAKVSEPIADEPIPYPLAKAWITNWNNKSLGEVGFPLFASEDGSPLQGYTYPLSDFQEAFAPPTLPNAALWLNYVLHGPNESTAPDTFSTVLTLNSIPVGTTPGLLKLSPESAYYDISKPCPPYC